ADAKAMLHKLLAPCGRVPTDLVEDAVEMTGGNPQLIEDWVRLLVDNGSLDTRAVPWKLDADRAAETELPIGVEQAIEARIAALSPAERDLLEKASIFGNVFWISGIVAMTRLESFGGAAASEVAEPKGFAAGDQDDEKVAILAAVAGLAERDYVLELP